MLEHGVSAHARHHHVEDDKVGSLVVDDLLGLLAVARLQDAVALALQDGPQPVAQVEVVIDDQNGLLVGHRCILVGASILASHWEGHKSAV